MAMRKSNLLKKRLLNGEIVLGPWCVLPSPAFANIIATSGIDFMIIDLEHGPTSYETAENMIRAADSEDCPAIIRVGSSESHAVLRALDIDAHGVMVPHVENSHHAREAVVFGRYRPMGDRGFSPFTRAGRYGDLPLEQVLSKANDNVLLAVIVEGGGVREEELAGIVATPGLDMVYVGAYDLSQYMGIPGQVDDPRVKQEMERCIRQIRDAGIIAGGYVAKNREDLRWMVDIGIQFITCLPDVRLVQRAFEEQAENLRVVLQDKGVAR